MDKITYNPDSIAFYNMENYCYEVARLIREKSDITIDRSHNMIYPLWHYIVSGRASTDFCKALMKTKPYMVARRIAQGGSDDEIMERIKKLVKI